VTTVSAAPFDFDTVDVCDVSKHYGRRRALAHVSLTGRGGEILGLLGPNGAGKSTLLNVLATLMRPSAGEVRYGGKLSRDVGDPLRCRIGVLGHDLFLYGDLSARENLEFFGKLYGVTPLAPRVDRALEDARLTDRAHDRVSGFSRGLRQRLALERALIHDPRLVLLDEPFTGLDDASCTALADRLRALRSSGALVLMATHDFDNADGLLDRAWCLHAGRAHPIDAAGGGSLRDRYRRALQGAQA
jgi:heme exporter protein A